jgi:hypothetical protein
VIPSKWEEIKEAVAAVGIIAVIAVVGTALRGFVIEGDLPRLMSVLAFSAWLFWSVWYWLRRVN